MSQIRQVFGRLIQKVLVKHLPYAKHDATCSIFSFHNSLMGQALFSQFDNEETKLSDLPKVLSLARTLIDTCTQICLCPYYYSNEMIPKR